MCMLMSLCGYLQVRAGVWRCHKGMMEFPGAGVIGCGGPCKHPGQKRNIPGEVGRKRDSAGLSQQVLDLTAGV